MMNIIQHMIKNMAQVIIENLVQVHMDILKVMAKLKFKLYMMNILQ